MRLAPASADKSKSSRGAGLIELVISMAIVGFILSWGLLVSVNFYRRIVLGAERDNVVAILRRARGAALGNVGKSSHGVFVGQTGYTIFRGSSYASRDPAYDENFSRGSGGIAVGGLSEVVFSAREATSGASGTVTLSSDAGSFDIHINYEGRID